MNWINNQLGKIDLPFFLLVVGFSFIAGQVTLWVVSMNYRQTNINKEDLIEVDRPLSYGGVIFLDKQTGTRIFYYNNSMVLLPK